MVDERRKKSAPRVIENAMASLFIPVVLGTARAGRVSERVARAVAKEVGTFPEVATQLVDVKDHLHTATLPPWGVGGADEKETAWKRIASRARGFVFVVPEYNSGYPGELKLFLDSLYASYEKKPVLVCGVSAGAFGGRQLVDHMRPVLTALGMVPIRGGVYVAHAKTLFDERGVCADPKFAEHLLERLEELVWFAKALQSEKS